LDNQDRVMTTLFYASDHGESLGENGLYLHGAPYFMAPEYQTRVPMLLWFGKDYGHTFEIDTDCVGQKANDITSHDNIFSTVLRLADVHTKVIDPALDLISSCHPDES
jgi:lipid A ethanolaminephosphotransferase